MASSAWLPSTRGLPRAYWTLLVGAFINRLGGFVVPFLALYLTQERGIPVERAGLIISLYGVGSIASGPVGGLLADVFGRRRTMIFALVASGLAMVHLGAARHPLQIAAATLLLGFVSDIYRPAMHAAIADVVPAADRTRAYGFLYWAANLGFAVASILAGTLARGGFTLLFIGDAITTLVFAAVVWMRVEETRVVAVPERHADEPTSRGGRFLAPYFDGVFVAFIAVQLAVGILFHQSSVTLPIDMGSHGISPAQFGWLIAINGVLIVVLQPFAVVLTERLPRRWVLSIGSLLVGVGFGLGAWAHRPLAYGLTIAVWTLGEIAISSASPTVITDLAPADLRGSYQGAFQLSWGAATFAGPALGSWVLGRWDGPTLWIACLIAGILAAAAQLGIAGARRRRVTELREIERSRGALKQRPT